MDTEFTPTVERYTEDSLKVQEPEFHPHQSGKKQSPIVLLVLLLLVLAIPVTAFVLSGRSQIADERSRAAGTYPCPVPPNKCTTSSLCSPANGGLVMSGSCTDPANPICCSFGATSTPKPPTATPTPLCSNGWIPTAGVGCCPGGIDVCSTVGATQCNGNILAECKVFNSACPAANRNYWAGVGSCTIGDPSSPNCISWTAADLGSGGSCVTGSYSCPGQTSYGSGCNLNGTRSVSNAPGQICLPNRLTCGVEQIDVNCTSTGFRFKSRMYTSTCALPPGVTSTPLPPASTITPPLIRVTNTPPPAITNTPPLIRVTNTPPPAITNTPPLIRVTNTPTKGTVATATPTRPVATSTIGTLTCQKLEAYLGTVNVTNNLSQIKYGDVVTFKGYANQTNTIVKSLSFQMTIAGVAQPILTVPATLETGIYTAKFQYTFTTTGAHIVKVISINK